MNPAPTLTAVTRAAPDASTSMTTEIEYATATGIHVRRHQKRKVMKIRAMEIRTAMTTEAA